MNLVPFGNGRFPFQIEVQAEWVERVLTVTYNLHGDLSSVLHLQNNPMGEGRKDELWKTTCFEWFFKPEQGEFYWECNLSPQGDWQLYRLEGYRQGLTVENLVPTISRQYKLSKNHYQLIAATDLSPLPLPTGDYDLNFTAVIKTSDASISYWAPRHPNEKPDFHKFEFFSTKISQL